MQHLHFIGELCHLDISGSNVMLRTDDFEPWDQVRLVDFGFCQGCLPGMHGQTVYCGAALWLTMLCFLLVGEEPLALRNESNDFAFLLCLMAVLASCRFVLL